MLRLVCISILCTYAHSFRNALRPTQTFPVLKTSPFEYTVQTVNTVQTVQPLRQPNKYRLYTHILKQTVHRKPNSRMVCVTYTTTPYHKKYIRRKNKRYALKYKRAMQRNHENKK